MNLEQSLQTALELTRDLSRALAEDRLDACQSLLAERGVCMQTFESLHRQAGAAERKAVAHLTRTLAEEDTALQEVFQNALAATGDKLKQCVPGQTATAPLPVPTGSEPGLLDRKA